MRNVPYDTKLQRVTRVRRTSTITVPIDILDDEHKKTLPLSMCPGSIIN